MRVRKHPSKTDVMEEAFACIFGYLSGKQADPIKVVRCAYHYIRLALLRAGISYEDDEVKNFIYARSSLMFSRYGELKTLCAVHALKAGMLPDLEEE